MYVSRLVVGRYIGSSLQGNQSLGTCAFAVVLKRNCLETLQLRESSVSSLEMKRAVVDRSFVVSP